MKEIALAKEQAYFDTLHERLNHLIRENLDKYNQLKNTPPSRHAQIRTEEEAYMQSYLSRGTSLSDSAEQLCFGKITLLTGEKYYIGKTSLSTEKQELLLMDWRAPKASLYYSATLENPQSVVSKRLFTSKNSKIINLTDEEFIPGQQEDLLLSQDSILLMSLNRQRTGKMQEIVSTISANQDRIMRLPHHGMLVISGPPGTGKTVVGLHRAAYLLYTERERLNRLGVLIIGPNENFLNYISDVLPLLGEYSTTSSTPHNLISIYPVKREDSEQEIIWKNDPKFISQLKEIINGYIKIPEKGLNFKLIGENLSLTSKEIVQSLTWATHQEEKYNEIRTPFLKHLLEKLTHKLAILREYEEIEEDEFNELYEELKDNPAIRKALNSIYLPYTPEQILYKISKDPTPLIERNLSHIASQISLNQENYLFQNYSPLDLYLIDELANLLGLYHAPLIEGDKSYNPPSNLLHREEVYGHLIVDEAQELLPLHWRALKRRTPSGSATILGDLNQRSALTTLSWKEIATILNRGEFHLEKLTLNYRTPKTLNDLAQDFLNSNGINIDFVESVRELDNCLTINTQNEKIEKNIILSTLAKLGENPGITKAILPESLISAYGFSENPSIISPIKSKGLEYDNILLVEPSLILHENSINELYVTLTRATQKLEILHHENLPFNPLK